MELENVFKSLYGPFILVAVVLGCWLLVEAVLAMRAFKSCVRDSAITAIPFELTVRGKPSLYYAVEADDYVAYRIWIQRKKREAEREERKTDGTR